MFFINWSFNPSPCSMGWCYQTWVMCSSGHFMQCIGKTRSHVAYGTAEGRCSGIFCTVFCLFYCFQALPRLQQEMVHCSVVVGYISHNILLHLSSHPYTDMSAIMSYWWFTAAANVCRQPHKFSPVGIWRWTWIIFLLIPQRHQMVECQIAATVILYSEEFSRTMLL